MASILFISMQFAILAYALVSGVFLAFSDFIMRSLAHSGGVGGIDTMQVINREVFRWVFMTLFIGLAPISLLVAAYGGIFVGNTPGTLMMTAGLIYVIGCFGITVFFNVPMNEMLANMDASASATQDYWVNVYLPRWTFWNTVRTFASGLSSALLMYALLLMAQNQS